MRRLQVVPVLGGSFSRSIPELFPSGHRFDLINNKRKWMLAVAWLIIMYRPEPPLAYAAFASDSFQSRPVLSPHVAVCTARVVSFCHVNHHLSLSRHQESNLDHLYVVALPLSYDGIQKTPSKNQVPNALYVQERNYTQGFFPKTSV